MVDLAARVDELLGATHAPALVHLNPLHTGAHGIHRRLVVVGRELRSGFVTAAEQKGWSAHTRVEHDKHTTCNLHSFLDYLFVSTLDACLKETCRSVCKAEEKPKPGHAKPSRSKTGQLQARSFKPSHSKPGH